MDEQLSFFNEQSPVLPLHEPGAYRHNDPDTSVAAAMSVDASRLEGIVVEALCECTKGATTRELSEILGIDWGSISPRMAPLQRKGLIYATSERRVGKSGRSGIVWMARK